MTNENLAWLAGIIDGEGCIGLFYQGRGRGRKGVTTRLTVQNTSIPMILEVKRLFDTFGCDCEINCWKKTSILYRPVYQVGTGNKHIMLAILQALYPYLIAKKQDSEFVIKFLKKKCSVNNYRVTEQDMLEIDEFRNKRHSGENLSEITPIQAEEGKGSSEGVETREVSPNNNLPHECPTRK